MLTACMGPTATTAGGGRSSLLRCRRPRIHAAIRAATPPMARHAALTKSSSGLWHHAPILTRGSDCHTHTTPPLIPPPLLPPRPRARLLAPHPPRTLTQARAKQPPITAGAVYHVPCALMCPLPSARRFSPQNVPLPRAVRGTAAARVRLECGPLWGRASANSALPVVGAASTAARARHSALHRARVQVIATMADRGRSTACASTAPTATIATRAC